MLARNLPKTHPCSRGILLKYPSMLKNYKAIFFDVGGTLLRVHPSVGDVYATHARDYGFTGSPDDLNREFRQEWSNMGGMESLGQQKGLEVERAFWKELVRRVFEKHGGLEHFDRYFEHIYDVFRSKESWRVFEDVTGSGLLDQLKDNGIVLGVVSNWDSRLPEILRNTGLASYFNFILLPPWWVPPNRMLQFLKKHCNARVWLRTKRVISATNHRLILRARAMPESTPS